MSKLIYRTNALKRLAEQYIESDEIIQDSEIRKIDITSIFENEVYNEMPKNRESVNINITAPVRSGKSTTAAAIGYRFQDTIVQMGYTTRKWSIFNVARSLYELSKKMRMPTLNNIMIWVDEFDDLENSQINATVEKSLLDHFSKIQAGRYIHRIYCSPSDAPDQGSQIHLQIDQTNKENQTTKCLCFYKVQKADKTYIQMIGHVIIDVYISSTIG